MTRIIYFLLLAAIFWRPLVFFYQNLDSITSRNYNYPLYTHLYYNSQYVKKDHPGIIPDQTLEGFIAGALLHGVDSINVIHDQPPLGRYINALSILIFDNVLTVSKFLILFSLIGLILVSQQVLGKSWLALLPIAIFSNESLFMSKVQLSIIVESIQLPFIIFCIYAFIRGVKGSNKWFILCAILLGFVISIRYFVLGGALLLSFLSYLLLLKSSRKKFRIFLLSLPLSIIVLFISYFKTIQNGHSILDILKIQKYIFVYHQSAITLPFSFWDLLLFNRWHTWWGNYAILKDPDWNIIWPFSFAIILIGLFKTRLFKTKIKLSEGQLVIFLWILFYSLMLSIGYSSTRYFLPFIPFLYILAVSLLPMHRLTNA